MKKFLLCIIFLAISVNITIAIATDTRGDAGVNQTNASPSYYITIDPIGNHTVSDVIFINGTTNLPEGDNLSVVIQDGFDPGGGGPFFYSSVPIQPGKNGINFWSCNITPVLWSPGPRAQYGFTFTAANFPAGDYGVGVIFGNNVVDQQQILTILPAEPEEISTLSLTQTPPPTPTTMVSLNETAEMTPPPSTTPTSPLSLIVPLMAIAGIVILQVNQRRIRR